MKPAIQTSRRVWLFVPALFLCTLSSCTSSASTNSDALDTGGFATTMDLGTTEADRGMAREDIYDSGSPLLVDASTFDAFPERQVFDAVSEGDAASDTSLVTDSARETTVPFDAGLACGPDALQATFVDLEARVRNTGCLSFRYGGLQVYVGSVGPRCEITGMVGAATSPPETPMIDRVTVETHFSSSAVTSTGRVPITVVVQFFEPGFCNLPNGSCYYTTPHGRLVAPSCFVEVLQAGRAVGDLVAARLVGDCVLQEGLTGRLPPIQLRGLEFQTRLVEGPAFGNPDAGVLCD